MTGFKQATSDFRLRTQPKEDSPFVVPEVEVTLTDKLEIVGEPVIETFGPSDKITWLKVKCSKGEGFADNEKLQDFEEPKPVPPELLPIELKPSMDVLMLAELCYRNALHYGTNSAMLLAFAHAATGDAWAPLEAKPKAGERLGVFGFTEAEWDAAVKELPKTVDVKPDHIDRARAQCEIAAWLSGKHWQKLVSARGPEVRAIDLYLAFLFGADVAVKILAAADTAALSTFLSAAEADAVVKRIASTIPDGGNASAGMLKGALVKALMGKLRVSLDFVRSFAEKLVETAPPVDGSVDQASAPVRPADFNGPVIKVTDTDLDALARTAQSEVEIFANFGEEQLVGGAAAVVDTIFNRVAHPSFPDSIVAVVNQPSQFSAINKLGTWTKLPEAKPVFFTLIKSHVQGRASGQPSAIRGACHFLNPNTSDQSALKTWAKNVVKNPIAKYGDIGGTFVHFHGFPAGDKPPPAHAIEFAGKTGWFDGAGKPLAASQPPAAVAVVEAGSVGSSAGGAGPLAAVLPAEWKPPAPMKRVICHWTAGGHTASDLDRFHYHVLIEGDGRIVRGRFSITDNVSGLIWKPRTYAAHTKGTNTGSIGVSVCCMSKAKEKPFDAGKFPMTQVQWNRLVEVVADLCRTYGIDVTPKTVLGHGEVQANLGNPQDGKWDPMVLPWKSSMPMKEVGDLFRSEVRKLLT